MGSGEWKRGQCANPDKYLMMTELPLWRFAKFQLDIVRDFHADPVLASQRRHRRNHGERRV